MIRWSLQDIANSPLPNLVSFRVTYDPQIENAHVLAILAPSLKKRSLRSLDFSSCSAMDLHSLEWLVTHGNNLEELAIGDNSAVTDEMLIEVTNFKRLRYLDLSKCGISRFGLMNVVNGSSGALREVNISECRRIDSDAVQLVKKSGLKITHWPVVGELRRLLGT